MNESTPAKRRRGGQPGNQNAKGNCGNANPRRNYGNRGGQGAPTGNQYARRRPRGLSYALLAEYQNDREAREWIEANHAALASFSSDEAGTDAADIAMHQGLIAEDIAAHGREYEFGLYVKPEVTEREGRLAA